MAAGVGSHSRADRHHLGGCGNHPRHDAPAGVAFNVAKAKAESALLRQAAKDHAADGGDFPILVDLLVDPFDQALPLERVEIGAKAFIRHAKLSRSVPAKIPTLAAPKSRRFNPSSGGEGPKMPWTTPSRIAVIGYGAITDEIVRCLDMRGQLEALACVLVRAGRRNELAQKAGGRFCVVDVLADLLACRPQIVIEAAGHAAVADFGAAILASGCDLLPASVGALADSAIAKSSSRRHARPSCGSPRARSPASMACWRRAPPASNR